MKKTLLFLVAFAFFFAGILAPVKVYADGCYLCEGGGYVKYHGTDTFQKRKQAEKMGCKVTGTTGSCSQSKGTVN